MPVNMSADFLLDGKPFMLARGQFKGRAWRRTGLPNAVRPSANAAEVGRSALPPEIDFVAVYDDFSGGYGDAYRDLSRPNRVHWSENFDLRWPKQAVHCQAPQMLAPRYSLNNLDVNYLYDVPLPVAAGSVGQPGTGAVLVLHAGRGISRYVPTGLQAAASMFDAALEYSIGTSNTFGPRPAIFGSFSYLPGGIGNDFNLNFHKRSHDGLTFTASTMRGGGFTVAGNRMWRTSNVAPGRYINVQSAGANLDPFTEANWSATLTIGDGYENINDITTLGDQVFLGVQDGLYAGDLSGTFYNVLSELQHQRHIDNGRDLTIHEGQVVTPNVSGLWAFRPSDFVPEAREIGPLSRSSNRSPVRGRYRSVKSYGAWLYTGIYDGSQSYVLAGRESQEGYVWHVQQRLPNPSKISRIHFDGITSPSGGGMEIPTRCWIATDATFNTGATSALYMFPIPRLNENPLTDPTFSVNYMGSARMDFGRDNRGAPDTLKVLRRVDVNTDASTFLSGSRYWDVYYTVDGGIRTLLGRAQDSPKTVLYFPAGNGSFVTGYDFEMSVESFGTASMCPIGRSLVVHGAFLPAGSDQITAVVRIADGIHDRTGTPMRSGVAMMTDLWNVAGGQPVQLIDLTGAVNWVSVQRDVDQQEVYQEGSDWPEVAATVKMTVLSFSGPLW